MGVGHLGLLRGHPSEIIKIRWKFAYEKYFMVKFAVIKDIAIKRRHTADMDKLKSQTRSERTRLNVIVVPLPPSAGLRQQVIVDDNR
jgi:hypothetical protein